jgi:hypothetical protein
MVPQVENNHKKNELPVRSGVAIQTALKKKTTRTSVRGGMATK